MSSLKAPAGKLIGISRRELVDALQRSVGLQSFYAKSLNQYDGGERLEFKTVEEWIARLRECDSR